MDAESPVIVARAIGKDTALDGPPPHMTVGLGTHPTTGGLNAVTCTLVLKEARSDAGTVAVSRARVDWVGAT